MLTSMLLRPWWCADHKVPVASAAVGDFVLLFLPWVVWCSRCPLFCFWSSFCCHRPWSSCCGWSLCSGIPAVVGVNAVACVPTVVNIPSDTVFPLVFAFAAFPTAVEVSSAIVVSNVPCVPAIVGVYLLLLASLLFCSIATAPTGLSIIGLRNPTIGLSIIRTRKNYRSPALFLANVKTKRWKPYFLRMN